MHMNPLPYLAISMGLLSSFHCVGMCGPISLALPVRNGSRFYQFAALLLYNIGRAFTYAAFGMLIGLIGTTLAWMGFLRYLSVIAGGLMLLYVVFSNVSPHFTAVPAFWKPVVHFLRKSMSQLLQKRSLGGWFLLGMLNGMLPCGMVYLALTSSVATGGVASGAIYMLLFGMATFPAMLTIGVAKQWFTPERRGRMRRLAPVMVAMAGIWLVARGVLMQYSTSDGKSSDTITTCHGK
jgi:sulfite exporter TauE/SafE